MGNEQTALSFGKGITNVPSDAICDDNALEECMGMVFEDGEHRVIQKPVEFMTGTQTNIICVHKVANQENYIGYEKANGIIKIRWGTRSVAKSYNEGIYYGTNDSLISYSGDTAPEVAVIGKTLIINYGSLLNYFLWKPEDGKYKYLGNTLNGPDIRFGVQGVAQAADGYCPGWLYEGSYNVILLNSGYENDYRNLIIGLYNKAKNNLAADNYFVNPFFVRFALELFDGSYACVSNPILIFPTIRYNGIVRTNDLENISLYVQGGRLQYWAEFDYSEWTDIIRNVVVFASRGVEVTDFRESSSNNSKILPTPSRGVKYNDTTKIYHDSISLRTGFNQYDASHEVDLSPSKEFVPTTSNGDTEILEGLKTDTVFYKISELGLIRDTTGIISNYQTLPIKKGVVENIETQEILKNDDYFGHCTIAPKTMLTYNQRLVVSNISRGFFEGFSSFVGYDNTNTYTYDVYVYINTPSGTRVVKKSYSTNEKVGIYFYYPDPRAYQAIVFLSEDWLLTMELKEHPFLNGAYYLNSLPNGTETEPTPGTGSDIPQKEDCENAINTTPEQLKNQLWISDASNPFAFPAEGNVTIGDGEIVGISSITQALSQGQFGQYPLIVFSSDGIWASSIASTGYISAVHPMSREVCNHPDSITQTDGAVFFASDKGLMVVVGSEVRCVSEQLSGKCGEPFSSFLRTAFVAYDYRDSLLWIFNRTSTVCWIYNIKSGTFAHYDFGTGNVVTNVVNDYPDYLLQIGSSIYSLLRRPNINDDGVTVNGVFTANTYSGQIITRPMKFDNALALKSIRQIMTVKQMEGSMTYRLFASNDLQSWVKLSSLRGMPWKYYKLQFDFSRLKATDRFGGAVIVTQERRTNKLR